MVQIDFLFYQTGYYPPKLKIKGSSIMIDERNFFNQPVNDIRTYENVWKIATGKGDKYATGCLLYYCYFK